MVKQLLLAAIVAAGFGADASIAAAATSIQAASPFAAPPLAARRMHAPPRPPVAHVRITPADRFAAAAAGWQQVVAPAPFGSNGAGTALLMTDGSVMISDNAASWYSLTPDDTGNYVKGTWTKKPTLPGNYAPLYFASAVLADGRLVINGGEYNNFQQVESNLGAIYDPVANAWSMLAAPSGWSRIGDAQSTLLADGSYMLGNCCSNTQAILNLKSLTWTLTGSGKADGNSEEGWTLLPGGRVLAADVGSAPNSEAYAPATGAWHSAGMLPANLTQSFEIGPQLLRPDGTVFVAGANGATAVYSTVTRAWTAGPNFPKVGGQQLDIADGPAALLTNGDVLMVASPGVYKSNAFFFDFNGTTLTRVPGPPNAPNDSSYNFRLLVLPTGQILATDSSNDVEIYTPNVKPDSALAPQIASVPATLAHGSTYMISGKRFNGASQANSYGDDAQSATNYPLVAITNTASGHVVFARTHDHTSMAVGSRATVATLFDVPAKTELGTSQLVVVANGIKSAPVAVTIR